MTVSYISSRARSGDGAVPFADALINGLAPDGGLYCPVEIPELVVPGEADTYAQLAVAVMWPFVEGWIPKTQFRELVAASYATFDAPEVCPLREVGPNLYLLDLTKGPTFAFKDVALQLLGRLLATELQQRDNLQVTVVTATSGDTGSAAIAALADRANIELAVLHPHERVSPVQRRQMTTVTAANVQNLAVEGSFDDCQDLVKAIFAQPELVAPRRPAAVNSINWARVMAQTVYYVDAARRVAPRGAPVSFAVPTGNFGNVLAGWYAKQMGLPVDTFVVASNRNDILTRFFETGRLESRPVEPSLSPAMDIQVSSNFERLLWEASDRDGPAIKALLTEFREQGAVDVPESWAQAIRNEMVGERLDDDGTLAEIARTYQETELLIDPHTAVALAAARKHQKGDVPMVVLSTADPAKFPQAVKDAVGFAPSVPPRLAETLGRTEHFDVIASSLDAVSAALRGSEPMLSD